MWQLLKARLTKAAREVPFVCLVYAMVGVGFVINTVAATRPHIWLMLAMLWGGVAAMNIFSRPSDGWFFFFVAVIVVPIVAVASTVVTFSAERWCARFEARDIG